MKNCPGCRGRKFWVLKTGQLRCRKCKLIPNRLNWGLTRKLATTFWEKSRITPPIDSIGDVISGSIHKEHHANAGIGSSERLSTTTLSRSLNPLKVKLRWMKLSSVVGDLVKEVGVPKANRWSLASIRQRVRC